MNDMRRARRQGPDIWREQRWYHETVRLEDAQADRFYAVIDAIRAARLQPVNSPAGRVQTFRAAIEESERRRRR